MNIVLTSKDEHLYMRWEPFATSTPLKPISNNAKIVSMSQKQVLVHNNYPHLVDQPQKNCWTTNGFPKESAVSKPLVSKKIRKKKSSIYFDVTSSSDDDSSDGNKKRPIIKLRSGKKTKSIVVSKNISNGKINTNKENNNSQKLENISINDCEKNDVFDIEDLKSKNAQSLNSKNRSLNDSLKLGSNFKDTNLSSEEDGKIFDETKKEKNITKDISLHLINKKDTVSNSKNDESLKLLNVSDNTEKNISKETFITNPSFKKSFHKNNGFDSESINIPQKRNSKQNKLCKSQKRKVEDNKNTINVVKKTRTTKVNDKLISHLIDMPVENSGNLLHIWEYKTNLSHQLFSYSKEQELINILDLTSEEVDEKVKNIESSLKQEKKKLPFKSCNSSHPSINNSLNQNEYEQNQPIRKKKNWKKCLMPENPEITSNKFLENVIRKKKIKSERIFKAKLKNNGHDTEFQMQQESEKLGMPSSEGVSEENLTKNNKKNLKAQGKSKIKATNVLEKSKTSSTINDLLNKNISDNKLKSFEVHSAISSVGSNMDNKEKSDLNRLLVPKEKKAVNRKKPVFKLLNELSFKENEMGCSVAQGWGINNFKCGIFKLKEKSQMSCKTLHNSSNLGGVLIKGSLRMKIGNKELNLKEGDMVFVPPLTEWLATNIGKCETLFYYWCGSFKV